MQDFLFILIFILEQALFYSAISLALIMPGFLLLMTLGGKSLHAVEKALLSIPLGFTLTTFTCLIIGKAGITLTPQNIFIICAGLNLLLYVVSRIPHLQTTAIDNATNEQENKKLFTWSKKSTYVLFALLILMFSVKGIYLKNTIFPTATDLGHHMFWVQKIMTTGEIPHYEKIIVDANDPENAAQSAAQFVGTESIPDFIIGEHIVFAIIGQLSGQDVVSAFPSLILFLFHIITVCIMALIALRMFAHTQYAQNAALWTLFLIGPLYAISGAQAKFVSGGVVGNIIGNMLIAGIIYTLYRTLSEKNVTIARPLFFVSMLMIGALIYTHHLSTFIFLYVLTFSIGIYLIMHVRSLHKKILDWSKLLLYPPTLVLICASIILITMIHTPSYLNAEAVSGSIGTPEKSTRVGLPLLQVITMSGSVRFFLAALGVTILILAITEKIRNTKISPYAIAIMLGWMISIILMSTVPSLLGVNILSTRIAAYSIFPLALVGGFFCAWFIAKIQGNNHPLTLPITTLLILIAMAHGMSDNARSLTKAPKTEQAVQTFHSASYVAKHTSTDHWSLKDHNFITADTWMKIFFAQYNPISDYSNPLSRGFFARYESKPKREHCTREMISKPESALAEECYSALDIESVTVNTLEDAGQFEKSQAFIKIYQNDEITTFWRTR